MNQQELDLPFPELSADQPLLPARMVNEYVYCPRLAYLEWVQGEWAESAETVQAAHAHRRVNRPGGRLPAAAELEDEGRIHARLITLSSNRLGLIAKLDLIESEDGRVVPVDYKHGKRPHVEKGAYAPERVQLCAQGMLLEEQGYECAEGVLYFVAGRGGRRSWSRISEAFGQCWRRTRANSNRCPVSASRSHGGSSGH